MLLSIIVPIYNSEVYLKDCLDSILKDLNNNTELILIDDGSTDNSDKIYCNYQQDNIKIFKNSNHGVSYSRNFGIKKATGKYVMFVDSDDLLTNGWYKKIESTLKEKDIYYFSGKCSNKNLSKNDIIERIIGYPNSDVQANFSAVWSKVFKKSFLLEHHLFFHEDLINGEDLLFNLSVLSKSNQYQIVPISIYKYRINFTSSTHRFNNKIFATNEKFLKEFKKELEKNTTISNFQKNEYYNFCLFNSMYIFIYRISLLSDKKERRKNYNIFNEVEYNNFFRNYKIKKEYGALKNLFIFLLKNKKYETASILMKIKNSIGTLKEAKTIMEEN